MAFRINASRRLLSDNYGNTPMVHSPYVSTETNEQKLSKKKADNLSEQFKTNQYSYNKEDLNAVENVNKQYENIKPLEVEKYDYTPDYTGAIASGAMQFGQMAGSGLLKKGAGNATKLMARGAGKTAKAAAKAAGATGKMARGIGKEAVGQVTKQLGEQASKQLAGTASKAGGWSSGATMGAGIGLGVIGELGKQHSLKNERLDNAAMFDYIGKFGGIGAMFGPLGLIGGATVGVALGAIKGGKDLKKHREAKAKHQREVNAYNARINQSRRRATAQAAERQRTAQLYQQANRTAMYQIGGKLQLPNLQLEKATELVPLPSKEVPIFRRGGVIDFSKENVILDGPSHEEHNKTGINGDKGLPIVKNGIKVAEIESAELVINANSMNEIEELRRRVKAGDQEAIIEIGNKMRSEISDNTYDYRSLEED